LENYLDHIENKEPQEEKREKTILIGVSFSSNLYDTSSEETLAELTGLLETAGGQKVEQVLQRRQAPDSATFIGSGKTQEIAQLVEAHAADLVVFDNELAPTQIRNLEDQIGVRVIDRSQLILDIFAMRAKTKEAKLQVELAQYKYTLPRLSTSYDQLSRLGGGIGTRGPGETKLETDRRYIKSRIAAIEGELKDVVRTRNIQRSRREKGRLPIIALMGYTNAGKSTLFNLLTQENSFVEDRLFATLETTTRKATLKDTPVLLTDTVGFIRKLPHHLIKAFRSTLEEVRYADILLHVVDLSNPDWKAHMEVVASLIKELGADHIPQIIAYNKCDRCLDDLAFVKKEENSCLISAKTGANVEGLIDKILQKLDEGKKCITLCLPYSKGNMLEHIHKDGEVLHLSYEAEYIKIDLRCQEDMVGRLKAYIMEEGK
jgi:GTP-binding protein HflX